MIPRIAAVTLVFLLAGASAGSVAIAQTPGKSRRIVYLTDGLLGPPEPRFIEAFKEGLRELGYEEGRNIVVEYRHASKPEDRQPIATEVLRLKPEVVVLGTGAVWFRELLRPLPMIFMGFSDPVGAGLVASLARPGGNMTGLSYLGLELNTKRLELLKEALPEINRIGVLTATGHPTRERQVREILAAAPTVKAQLRIVDVNQTAPTALDTAFEALVREKVQGVIALQGPGFFRERKHVVALALEHRLPGIFESTPFVEVGGLMSYAPNLADLARRSAGYVDRILKGAKPGEIPVEQPTKFEFVINMKTAKALDLKIPASLLLRADRLIE